MENVKFNYPPYIFSLTLLVLLSSSCTTKEERAEFQLQGKTMGTHYHLRIPLEKANDEASQQRLTQLQTDIDALLVAINQEMSTYLTDSNISSFNQLKSSDWFPVSTRFFNIITTAQSISTSSQGAFDITVMPLVNLWGFGTTKQSQIPTQSQIQNTLKTIGYQSLQTRSHPAAIRKQKNTLTLDLSAIAKGYAVDAIASLLEKQHIANYLIEIGGEIRVRGTNKQNKAWRIAIEKPALLNRSIQQGITLNNIAVATSGDYRNYYEKNGKRYSHTINPKTGKPITHQLASVTVINPSAMLADTHATAIMVLGESKGRHYIQQQQLMVYMIIRKGNGFSVWHNLPSHLLIPH